ncbi:alpha/beta hydrolase [Chelatococcus sp. SYSU_G07232]|uniref:Alpha/beta hydrolase n=1 Tax=Chelatococcus albus TaxID=3047466 RepID=A0ABT7AF01_9HYPH|nr:alpha/beta hydrolase [Chelatococcus sp. SYSU_G07232]MDJ1157953.1 alpha/beta hydrolase [Chelatococcus sp. SYSU_G07232]
MTVTEIPTHDELFPGFRAFDITTPEVRIRARVGGEGAPLLLLHGYPQTHVMWHRIAPRLADRFAVVCADLRGYGDSGKPATASDHAPYSKRTMAADMVAVMRALGHERFFVAGHDRGGRVAHRLALDHPQCVLKLATLDIAPTREMYRNTTEAFAPAYWHWFFLIQPAPFPERMIGADPQAYWLKKCGSGSAGLAPFLPEALAEYLRCFRDPAAIHASCEDYRAAAGIDIAHDDADGGRKVAAPLLALWGAHGAVGRCFDVLGLWRERAIDVRGHALPGGHYLAEELPDEVGAALSSFFLADRASSPGRAPSP